VGVVLGRDDGFGRSILGGGCFWCLEAAYRRLEGVVEVTNGYAGGARESPSYDEVCSGQTGHAEVVAIDFDPSRVTFDAILDLFWKIHDPTTGDRQGADVGSQYRSVIFYADEEQRFAAEASIRAIGPAWRGPIVTQLAPAPRFWPAEDYHQDYYDRHPYASYCRAVIVPKLRKAGLPE
jgi:peptide-methionine (S)-S-oxide reductase